MPDNADNDQEKTSNPVDLEAYWHERKTYLTDLAKLPGMQRRLFKAIVIYLLRRFLWSFAFFPIFLTFWIPLVLSRFNPVAMIQGILPNLQTFVNADPQQQAATIETVIIAWLSVGITFAIFDLILTPFRSPFEYEADVHMRAWTEIKKRNLM
jgi:hypothetical protein